VSERERKRERKREREREREKEREREREKERKREREREIAPPRILCPHTPGAVRGIGTRGGKGVRCVSRGGLREAVYTRSESSRCTIAGL
jgi:hypothetical protein